MTLMPNPNSIFSALFIDKDFFKVGTSHLLNMSLVTDSKDQTYKGEWIMVTYILDDQEKGFNLTFQTITFVSNDISSNEQIDGYIGIARAPKSLAQYNFAH